MNKFFWVLVVFITHPFAIKAQSDFPEKKGKIIFEHTDKLSGPELDKLYAGTKEMHVKAVSNEAGATLVLTWMGDYSYGGNHGAAYVYQPGSEVAKKLKLTHENGLENMNLAANDQHFVIAGSGVDSKSLPYSFTHICKSDGKPVKEIAIRKGSPMYGFAAKGGRLGCLMQVTENVFFDQGESYTLVDTIGEWVIALFDKDMKITFHRIPLESRFQMAQVTAINADVSGRIWIGFQKPELAGADHNDAWLVSFHPEKNELKKWGWSAGELTYNQVISIESYENYTNLFVLSTGTKLTQLLAPDIYGELVYPHKNQTDFVAYTQFGYFFQIHANGKVKQGPTTDMNLYIPKSVNAVYGEDEGMLLEEVAEDKKIKITHIKFPACKEKNSRYDFCAIGPGKIVQLCYEKPNDSKPHKNYEYSWKIINY